tara:strand:- start:339 stop:1415 length:1077 start_codon:yes stop_codon:yes gene_type:complete
MNLPKPKKINAEKYVAGLSLFKQKTVKIKLSANESALGPSPRAIKEFNKASKNLKRYPDSEGILLRGVLANKFKLDPRRIILGSGSDQIFELICKSFLKKDDEVIVPEFSFIIYRIYSKIYGAKIKYAKEKNFRISINNIISKVNKRTKIVFLANPNNPTGTIISKKELLRLRKKLRSNILLVVDDAYFEYVKDKNYLPGMKLFSNSKNVIVTRTFSKIYGLAGLRVGWGYGPKNLIYALNKVKPPFNINRAALFAAAESIRDVKWLNKEIKHVNRWAKIFYNNFRSLGIETNSSYGNFLLINFNKIRGNAKRIFLKLAKKGILVRKMDVYKIKNSLRITIGNNFENKRFIKTLRKII